MYSYANLQNFVLGSSIYLILVFSTNDIVRNEKIEQESQMHT